MARFNEILTGRFSRALQKLTSIKGEAPAPVLGSEILPVFPLFYGNEMRYPESWQMFASFAGIGASVGNLNVYHFRNPVGSNVIAVITKISLSNSNAIGGATYNYIVEGPNPSTAADDQASTPNFARFDARGQQATNMKLSFGNPPTDTWPGNTKAWWAADLQPAGNTDVIITDDQEFPLLPGDAFRIVGLLANQGSNISVMWRERFLEESERT
jgi:hypothetical protein